MPVAVRGWQQAAVALISDTTWEIPLQTSAQPSPQINCGVAMGGANRVVAGLLLVVVTTVVAAVALHQQALAHAAVGAAPQSTSSSAQRRPSGNSSLSLLGLHTSGTTRTSVRGTNDVAISRMGSSSILHVLQRSAFLSAREQQTMGKSLLLRSVIGTGASLGCSHDIASYRVSLANGVVAFYKPRLATTGPTVAGCVCCFLRSHSCVFA